MSLPVVLADAGVWLVAAAPVETAGHRGALVAGVAHPAAVAPEVGQKSSETDSSHHTQLPSGALFLHCPIASEQLCDAEAIQHQRGL